MKTTSFSIPPVDRDATCPNDFIENSDDDRLQSLPRAISESTPLLNSANGRPYVKRRRSSYRSQIGIHQFSVDTCSSEDDEHRSFRTMLSEMTPSGLATQIKILFLFVIMIWATAIIASVEESEAKYYALSVSRIPTHVRLNWQRVSKQPVEMILYIRGIVFTDSFPTHNLTVDVMNRDSLIETLVYSYRIPRRNSSSLSMVTNKLVALGDKDVRGNLSLFLRTNHYRQVTIGLDYRLLPAHFSNATVLGMVVLLIIYGLIIVELVHRAVAAMLGSFMVMAVLSFYNLRPSMSVVIGWLNMETLSLLFGMMVIVAIFTDTGFFDWMALMAYKIAKGKIWILLVILCGVSAFVSAFLDNVTTMLLVAPVTIRLCEALRIPPQKILLAEVIFSNIGGTATAVGDPPNVLIVSNDGLKEASGNAVTFVSFIIHMGLGSLFVLAGSALATWFLFRGLGAEADKEEYEVQELRREVEVWRRTALTVTMATREEEAVRDLLIDKMEDAQHRLQRQLSQVRRRVQDDFYQTFHRLEEEYFIKDKVLLGKTAFVLVFVIISFVVCSLVPSYHLDLGWIALLGATWLLILSDTHDLEVLLCRVEWSTLVFFAALFAFMEGIQEVGVMDWIGDQVVWLMQQLPSEPSSGELSYTQVQLVVAILLVQWVSALVSCFIDNIPFTTAMIPVVLKLSESGLPLLPLVWALAFGTCLGGNGTLIGASANVVCVGIASQHDYPITFFDFFKVGFPIMIVSNVIASCYLMVCHVALQWND